MLLPERYAVAVEGPDRPQIGGVTKAKGREKDAAAPRLQGGDGVTGAEINLLLPEERLRRQGQRGRQDQAHEQSEQNVSEVHT